MTRPKDTPPLGAVVADLGANLICVLVILIALAALKSAPASPTQAEIAARPVASAPLSGAAQSDLLHQRLRPPPDVLLVELRPDAAFAIAGNSMVPLAQVPAPWPRKAALFVFSPAHYETAIAQLAVTGITVTEMTVPQALRGATGFSQDFLTLRVSDDPDSIREPLLRLLTRGPNGSAMGQDGEREAAQKSNYTSLFKWLSGIFQATLNLLGAVIAVLILRHLHRRRA